MSFRGYSNAVDMNCGLYKSSEAFRRLKKQMGFRKVYVTGSKGFVGKNLMEHLKKEEKLEIVECDCDIRFPHMLYMDIPSDTDIIIHLAAKTKANESMVEPHEYLDTNAMGTVNILEVMRKKKIPKMIFYSSGGVKGYGEGAPYLWSKRMAEMACAMYCKLYGLQIIIFRPTNIYGPHNWKGVIWHFQQTKKKRKPLKVYGDGSQTRDFVHVYDVVDATMKAMKLRSNAYPIYLEIGTGVETSVLELAKKISKKYVLVPEKQNEVGLQSSVAKIATANLMLNWKPKITLKKGLKMT